MATLKLIDSLQEVKIRHSDRLYYDRYEFCLAFYLDNLSTMRSPFGPVEVFKDAVRERFENRRVNMLRHGQRNIGGSWRTVQNPEFMNEAELNRLLAFADVLVPMIDHCKLVVFGNHGYIYSNDIVLLKQFVRADVITPVKITQIAVTRDRQVIALKSSDHTHRSYFRDRTLTDDEYTNLRNFLSQRTDVRFSPALRDWLKDLHTVNVWGRQRYIRRYTQRHWFVDHDAGMPLMLELVVPRLIRQTKPIQVNS